MLQSFINLVPLFEMKAAKKRNGTITVFVVIPNRPEMLISITKIIYKKINISSVQCLILLILEVKFIAVTIDLMYFGWLFTYQELAKKRYICVNHFEKLINFHKLIMSERGDIFRSRVRIAY